MFLIGETECVSNIIELYDKRIMLDKNFILPNAQAVKSLLLNLMPGSKSMLE